MDCSEDMNTERGGRESGVPAGAGRRRETPRVLQTTSHALFRGSELLLIEHEGKTYTLRQTRQGKLILNK